MTDNNHPITPPEELVRLWLENYFGCWDDVNVTVADASSYIATQTSQWIHEQRGADIQKARDEELEACCAEMREHWGNIHNTYGWELSQNLRAARRPKPKPPSLKEQALKALDEMKAFYGLTVETDTIRRALNALSD